MAEIISIFQDLPGHISLWVHQWGPIIYVFLFLILFAETGLVFTPFLPGDSLLFALGTLTAGDNPALNYSLLAGVLLAGVYLGDLCNYNAGRYLAPRLFRNPNSKLFNPSHLKKTHNFYEKYGSKTIILARFVPIVRTYAPFVAGMGTMKFSKFIAMSFSGALLWVFSFLSAGHFFGNMPGVRSQFHYVIIAIIIISVLPAVYEIVKARRELKSVRG